MNSETYIEYKYKDMKQISKLWFVIGMLMTMPVFRISLGDYGLALYNIPLFFFYAISITSINITCIKRSKLILLLFMLSLMISTIVSSTVVPNEWFMFSVRASIKLILTIAFFVFCSTENIVKDMWIGLINGLICVTPIQFIWMLIQFSMFRFAGIRINTLLFGVQTYAELSTGITLTGFSWERADLIIPFVIATAFSTKNYIKLMAGFGIVLSGSRSGMIMVAAIYMYRFLADLLICKKLKMKTVKKVFVVLFLVLCATIIVSITIPSIKNQIIVFIDNVWARIMWTVNDVSEYSISTVDPHKMYYIWLPGALKNSSLLQLLFGSGTRISGWMYTKIFHRASTGPWAVECDFISLILGNGFFGAIIYYLIFIQSYVRQNNIVVRSVIVSLLLGTFMYRFYDSTLGLVLLMLLSQKNLPLFVSGKANKIQIGD